jgi:Ca2+-binding RTX toxin-like protein
MPTYYDYTGGYPNNPEDYNPAPNPDLVNPGPNTSYDTVITGTAGADNLVGTSGNDRIDGGAGNDLLYGGLGDDSYYVTVGDQVADDGGIDTIYFTGSGFWRLAPNIENIVAYGTGPVDFRGNNDANIMVGGAGDDYMNGRGGDDQFYGMGGNDTFDMSTGRPSNATGGIWTMGNRIVDGGEGIDTIDYDGYARSSVTIDLGAGYASGGGDLGIGYAQLFSIERAVGGAYDDTVIGSSVSNDLFGRGGNDVLDGGAGADNLRGGIGNDTYYVDNAGDAVIENSGEGTDTVLASLSWTLGTNVENLSLTGTAALDGTGNSLANALTGNAGANVLSGGAGSDRLDGGAGADRLLGGTGNDTYVLGRGYGADRVIENDKTKRNTDVVQFQEGIAKEQVWFERAGNDLVASIIGTSDQITIQDWYRGSQYHVEQFRTADGATLLDSQVQNLVNAMAAFTPPAAGQTTLPDNYAAQLEPVIASNWH